MNFLKTNIEPINANPWSEISSFKKVGEGTTANVFKVLNSSGQIFALKEFKINLPLIDILEEYSKTVLSENKNVASSYALYHFNNQYSILLEYLDMTLFKFINDWERDNENLIGYIIKQILIGVEFIHRNYSIHRDLKADNILVNRRGEVKVADFGLCAQLYRDRDERDTVAGSPLWSAPEIIKGKKYTSKCDIWSIGMICFELIDGVPVYSDCKNYFELSMKIDRDPEPRIPDTWSSCFQEFVGFCLKKDPELRMTAAELLKTDFMNGVDDDSGKELLASLIQMRLE